MKGFPPFPDRRLHLNKEKPMDTQNKKILDHIKHFGGITTYEAFMYYKITRLSARIYELRRAGHDIRKVMVGTEKNTYAKYYK